MTYAIVYTVRGFCCIDPSYAIERLSDHLYDDLSEKDAEIRIDQYKALIEELNIVEPYFQGYSDPKERHYYVGYEMFEFCPYRTVSLEKTIPKLSVINEEKENTLNLMAKRIADLPEELRDFMKFTELGTWIMWRDS